jgi:hypothetical protein
MAAHTPQERGEIMAQETIVFAQGIEMPPHQRWPSPEACEFALRLLPSTAKPEIAAAMRDAEYSGLSPVSADEAYLETKRLKLVQVLSAGCDAVNIAGPARPVSPSARAVGPTPWPCPSTPLLILSVYRKVRPSIRTWPPDAHTGIPASSTSWSSKQRPWASWVSATSARRPAVCSRSTQPRLLRSPGAAPGRAEAGRALCPSRPCSETSDVVSLPCP